MGLFDFIKDAGDKLFGGDQDEPAAAARGLDDVLADKRKGESLSKLVGSMGMSVEGLQVAFREGVATVEGKVASQADKEKIVLLMGNTQGVARVDDRMEIAAAAAKPEPEATMYTVQPGDSLSKIAKAHYGNAMKYTVIFEANTPMLKHPDKIYPGQVLRIPPLES